MATFTVTWSIQIDAKSAEDAAYQAKMICNDMTLNPDDANVFTVTPGLPDTSSTNLQSSDTVEIDLGALNS